LGQISRTEMSSTEATDISRGTIVDQLLEQPFVLVSQAFDSSMREQVGVITKIHLQFAVNDQP
jgi:hypothetical protein